MMAVRRYISQLVASALAKGFADGVRGRPMESPYRTSLTEMYVEGWRVGDEKRRTIAVLKDTQGGARDG